jgi:hypothetical protein
MFVSVGSISKQPGSMHGAGRFSADVGYGGEPRLAGFVMSR